MIAYRNIKDKHNLKGSSFIDIKNVATRTSRGSISGLATAPREESQRNRWTLIYRTE